MSHSSAPPPGPHIIMMHAAPFRSVPHIHTVLDFKASSRDTPETN